MQEKILFGTSVEILELLLDTMEISLFFIVRLL